MINGKWCVHCQQLLDPLLLYTFFAWHILSFYEGLKVGSYSSIHKSIWSKHSCQTCCACKSNACCARIAVIKIASIKWQTSLIKKPFNWHSIALSLSKRRNVLTSVVVSLTCPGEPEVSSEMDEGNSLDLGCAWRPIDGWEEWAFLIKHHLPVVFWMVWFLGCGSNDTGLGMWPAE